MSWRKEKKIISLYISIYLYLSKCVSAGVVLVVLVCRCGEKEEGQRGAPVPTYFSSAVKEKEEGATEKKKKKDARGGSNNRTEVVISLLNGRRGDVWSDSRGESC